MNKDKVEKIFLELLHTSEHFLLDEEALDYYAGEILNLLNEPSGLAYEEAASEFKLPKKFLYKANNLGVLSNPLTHLDKLFLEKISKIWGIAWFIRMMLVKYNKHERLRLLDAPKFIIAWERRVYYWYLTYYEGHKDECNQFYPSTTLPVKTVLIELLYYFPGVYTPEAKQWIHELMRIKGMTLYEPVEQNGKVHRRKRKPPAAFIRIKKRVEEIRKAAHKDRSYSKRKGDSIEVIMEKRGLNPTDHSPFMNTHRKSSINPEIRAPEDIFDTNDKLRM